MDEATLKTVLSPWRHANGKLLGGTVLSACSAVAEDRMLWVEWTPPESDAESAIACLECVALIQLIAQIDRATSHSLLTEICDDYARGFVEEPESVAWPVGLQIDVDEETNCALLAEWFGWVDEVSATHSTTTQRTNKFTHAKRLLESLRDPREDADVAVPVRLTVWAGPEGDVDTNEILGNVRDLARLARDSSRQVTGSGTFRWSECCVELPWGATSSELLRTIGDIMRFGVRVSRLVVNPELCSDSVDRLVLAQVLNTMLLSEDDTDGVTTLSMRTDIEQRLLIPLCSALMQSRCVRRVIIDTFHGGRDDEISRETWCWLALALFSSLATPSVESLELYASCLKAESVSVVTEILDHHDPIGFATLAEMTASRDSTRSTVNFVQGTDIWLPDTEPDSHSSRRADFTCSFDVQDAILLEDNPNDRHMGVLVPGMGVAKILREPVQCQRHDRLDTNRPRNGFRRILLAGVMRHSADPACALLQLIGRSTTKLEISSCDLGRSFSGWLVRCIRACPMLDELVIGMNHIEAIDAILDLAEAEGPPCRLETLRLESVYSTRGVASFHRLFLALRDAHHPIANSLRHLTILSCDASTTLAMALWHGVLENIVDTLRFNKSLLSCRVGIPRSSVGDRPTVHEQFVRLNGECLPFPAGPFDLPSKLAFLSAINSPGRTIYPTSCRRRLASDTVELIFQFAAPCVRRVCVSV